MTRTDFSQFQRESKPLILCILVWANVMCNYLPGQLKIIRIFIISMFIECLPYFKGTVNWSIELYYIVAK